MKNISILIPEGNATVGCIEGTYTFFNKANDFLTESGKHPLFSVQMVGLTREVRLYGKFRVCPDLQVDEVQKTDLIIIPALNGDLKKLLKQNSPFLPWIVNLYKGGAEVASFCVGAFLLGATGLLKRKRCATHWLAVNEFRRMFPDTELMPERIIADEYGIYSSAGGNSFWNLLLYLIEKYTGRELAIQCAKYFEIDMNRYNQAAYDIFIGPRNHRDESVKQTQQYIERNFRNKMTVDHLSAMVNVGRRALERRFKRATYCTVSEYIQKVKIDAAKKNFEIGRKNIREIMGDIGYSDPKAFRTIFKRITGLSPIEYRNKYNKEVSA